MESIKSFLGNPYYLMTAVLAIAAFGFAATAVISLIQERKQKKEETQEEPLEKKLGVDTKKLKNVLNVPDLKRKKNIPVKGCLKIPVTTALAVHKCLFNPFQNRTIFIKFLQF